MKKTTMAFLTCMFALTTMAQEKNMQRTITVTGISAMEIVPDEIYVQVELKEYTKKNGDKIEINSIKNNFLAACKSIGLTDKDVMVQGYQGYDQNYWWNRKNKKQNPDMKASVTYWIKVSKVDMLDALVEKMDDEATQNFFIAKTSYSKMDEIKKDMKIAAVKAAKAKAIYLAEALDTQVGEAITINDPNETGDYPRPMMYENTLMKAGADSAAPPMDVDFKKLKLQFEVTVVFALK